MEAAADVVEHHFRRPLKTSNATTLEVVPTAWCATDDAEAGNAAGARWIAANADNLVIVADTEALTGPQRGPARVNLEFLIRRVQSNFRKDAITLLWSKTDLPRPNELVATVNRHFNDCFPGAPVFSVQVPDKDDKADETPLEALRELFKWAFATVPKRTIVDLPVSKDVDPFLSYRGW